MSARITQRNMVAEFVSLTGALDKVAQKFLKAAVWKMDIAVDNYFTSLNSKPNQRCKDILCKLFQTYIDPKYGNDSLKVDGVMRYLQDLEVNLESAEIFVPLEIVQAQGLGEISQGGFVDGWFAVGCENIPKQKSYVALQIKNMSTDMSLFKKVYRHAFFASKEASQKALPLDNAIVCWNLLFSIPSKKFASDSMNWLQLWIEYLQSNWKKTVNKDMWNQLFEFYLKSIDDKDLSFWSEDGAWPGVIDGFVVYVKPKIGLPDKRAE